VTVLPEHSLSAETRAVLAAAQVIVDARVWPHCELALRACPSPERVREAARAHGMLGNVQRVLSANRPGDGSLDRLESLVSSWQAVAALRSMRQTAALLRILERLDVAGVQAMPFKGPVWAQRLYGDVTRRTWADLDLLVAWPQMEEARTALLGLGFVDLTPFGARLIRRRRGSGAVHMLSEDGAVACDLHWDVSHGWDALPLTAADLLTRAVPLRLLGREVRTPPAIDMILITSIEGVSDRWNTVERILALGLQVRDVPEEEWSGVLAAARRAACERRVTVSVAHACRVLGLPLPPVVGTALSHDRLGVAMLATLTPASLYMHAVTVDGAWPSSPRVRLLWAAGVEDSLQRATLRVAARLLRPTVSDWATLPLPSGAAWLYYAWRPFRLTAKYLLWGWRVQRHRRLRRVTADGTCE
jgi:hypothetical protein